MDPGRWDAAPCRMEWSTFSLVRVRNRQPVGEGHYTDSTYTYKMNVTVQREVAGFRVESHTHTIADTADPLMDMDKQGVAESSALVPCQSRLHRCQSRLHLDLAMAF